MTNLLEKARAGRTNALAALSANSGDATATMGTGARFRTSNRYDAIPFISKRAPGEAAHWIH
ncbi:MAG: hypothetical protein ACC631_07545 [Halocynthiibacter sp.]